MTSNQFGDRNLSGEDIDSLKADAKRKTRALVEDYMKIVAKGKKDRYNEAR